MGAALAAIGAVGLGTYAMTGDAEADETRTTDQDTMKYNSTTGTFDNMEGDPVDQQSKLDWIAENPVKSGLGALPLWMGAGYGLSAAGMKKSRTTFNELESHYPSHDDSRKNAPMENRNGSWRNDYRSI